MGVTAIARRSGTVVRGMGCHGIHARAISSQRALGEALGSLVWGVTGEVLAGTEMLAA